MAQQNRRLSSANNRWEMHTPCQLDFMPLNWWLSSAFLSIADKPSTQSRNKYGESGSPCFILLDGVMKPRGSSFIRMEYEAVVSVSMAGEPILGKNTILALFVTRIPTPPYHKPR